MSFSEVIREKTAEELLSALTWLKKAKGDLPAKLAWVAEHEVGDGNVDGDDDKVRQIKQRLQELKFDNSPVQMI